MVVWDTPGEMIRIHQRSSFVNDMHHLNLTVHAYLYQDDQPIASLKTVNIKGIDGLYTDYTSSALKVFTYMGT